MTIQIPINLPNNNNDNQTNNSNNTNNTDNSNNNTNDNNSNNEDNQTDYDLDDDGIPDLVDNCPDTAQGAAVDSYGCTIDEQNNDNTQQDNTGQQQDSENTASKAEESNVLLYSIIGFILATVVIGVFIVKNQLCQDKKFCNGRCGRANYAASCNATTGIGASGIATMDRC